MNERTAVSELRIAEPRYLRYDQLNDLQLAEVYSITLNSYDCAKERLEKHQRILEQIFSVVEKRNLIELSKAKEFASTRI